MEREDKTDAQRRNFKLLKIESATNPLGSEDFIDIIISLKGRQYRGMLTGDKTTKKK